MSDVRRIVVSGAESTGKTTLARELADWLGTAWVPEHSRTYAEAKGAPLDAGDVLPIARGTVAAEEAMHPAARGGLLVLDTDLASTIVYAEHYYGMRDAALEAMWRARPVALYLLCHPDVPWIPDGIRDQPAAREALHERFASQLARAGAPVARVRGGDWAVRRDAARAAVRRVLGGEAPA